MKGPLSTIHSNLLLASAVRDSLQEATFTIGKCNDVARIDMYLYVLRLTAV